ncbi:MAG: sigma factor-like helix-turn-helix DNA-binding protein [Desulfoplanes sp.]|nr:sigma factor-like helix-turn-helix DNA-binding protein [Desulfoplanes sp.]MDD4650193.1 sigma factor-like helix-turn-helix DNA-binding protein [Desulfoplanes sp.]
MEHLSESGILVLSLYYADELTMRKVSEAMGITEGRISQIPSQSIRERRKNVTEYHGAIAV